MALTGKTIGQLTYLSGVTSDTLFPVELSGDTYQLAYSALTNSNYNESTYQELYDSSRNGTLTAGSFYLMTDFQTCYDQPNYTEIGDPITTGNYKTGTTEPILLLAISSTKFSPIVYSTINPQDKISYDITWNVTEVTNSPAKGRITERIDDKNNRADYDFRAVQFIRYVGYFSEQYYPGKISLTASTGEVRATVTGTTTFQSSFTPGDILGVYYGSAPISCFRYYEILTIESNSRMFVTGRTLTDITNTYYSAGQRLPDYMSPYQCNITGTTNDESAEYFTFNDDANNNTYLGDNINYNTFILSNNVFLSGSYNNNTFGGNVVGNTFNDDMDSNIIGPYCQYNIITNDFDRNNIGSYFQNNIIDCDMESNQIGNYFEYNMLGDDDGQDFDFNRIGADFYGNFLTFSNNDFLNNDIGIRFNNNIIDSGFRDNIISGNFFQNLIRNQNFDGNIIGYGFYDNNIPVTFDRNKLGEDFYNNNVWSIFVENDFGQNTYNNSFGNSNSIGSLSFSNNSIGTDFNNNYFSGNTEFNTIGGNCNTNTVLWDFQKNSILYGFQGNSIGSSEALGGIFESNQIMNGFKGNSILGSFTDNQIKTDFKGNDLFAEFRYNNVGENFFSNILSGSTVHNNIGDDFEFNILRGGFSFNTIGTNFGSNNIQDGFGVGAGGSYYMGNRIGNNFVENTVGNYFGNNTIADNFADNSLGSDFQWNIVDTNINSIDFTTNYGNIFGITYSSVGTALTNGVYTNVAGSTTGTGVNATFDVTVSGGTVTGVTINDDGKLYFTGDTITILGTAVGGVTGQISTFTVGGLGTLTGTTGTYNGIFALGGSGENAQFDVTVVDDLVDAVTLNFPFGSGYRVGDVLTIPGNTFGSTEAMSITVDTIYSDDVIITVTSVSQTPSVYESYTCNIFKNSALTNRLSYYDNSDVLTIKNINE